MGAREAPAGAGLSPSQASGSSRTGGSWHRLANFGLTPKGAAPMARVSSAGKITALIALGLLVLVAMLVARAFKLPSKARRLLVLDRDAVPRTDMLEVQARPAIQMAARAAARGIDERRTSRQG